MPGLTSIAAGGALGAGLSAAFGKGTGTSGTKIRQLTGGITSGGLKSDFIGSPKNRNISVTSSPQRQGLVNNIASLFGAQAGELGRLRGELTPGFGALTRARRTQIQNAARRSTGNLTDNLARRRVLGSSFGGDQITRAGREFGQAMAEADATSFLEELNANINLLSAESDAGRAEFETLLNEMNVQAETALGILSGSQASVANAFAASDALRTQFQRDLIGFSSLGAGGVAGLGAEVAGLFGGGGTGALAPTTPAWRVGSTGRLAGPV